MDALGRHRLGHAGCARQTEAGGQSARLAHRDLDAICALFDAGRPGGGAGAATSGVREFLDTLPAQEIPADTLADRGVRGDAVRLLTAHRSKGLEWRARGRRPRAGGRLARPAAPRHAAAAPTGSAATGWSRRSPRAALLAEERRLFYVAATRARRRLVVTAVASPDDDGEQPSRFLHELGAGEPGHHQGRPRRPLSLAGLVAELRRTTADPTQPDDLRRAAAHRLAALAATEVHGRPLAPAADPATWWGLRAPSRASTPVRPDGEPVRLSASALQGLLTCPAQWFLQQEAGGAVVSSTAQGFGIIVHALADRVAKGELAPDDVMDDLMALVDDVWDRMSFRTPWSGEREREAVRDALARFVAWQTRPGARTQVSTEGRITATVDLPDGQQVAPARLRRPARARRRRRRRGRRPQDRQVRPDRHLAARAPPARPLPARGRTTGPPTRSSVARSARGEPSWSSCGSAPTCPRSSRRDPRSRVPTASPRSSAS